jgi:hypothetical protein
MKIKIQDKKIEDSINYIANKLLINLYHDHMYIAYYL